MNPRSNKVTRSLPALAAIALGAGLAIQVYADVSCCQETNNSCPGIHGPGGYQPPFACGGACCSWIDANGVPGIQCCAGGGHCLFYSIKDGTIYATCEGAVPWPGAGEPW